METHTADSVVRGYHVYSDSWSPVIGEVLVCEREPGNDEDMYAVAVLQSTRIVGHLPRKDSRKYSLFLRRGGAMSCEITGLRQYSADLPQGGIEIPCKLTFEGEEKEIKKLIRLTVSKRKDEPKRHN